MQGLETWIHQPWVVLVASQSLQDLGCKGVTGESPVRLIHCKMLVQTLLPSSTVCSLGAGGGGWTRAAHSAQDAQTGKLPPAFLLWGNPDLLCFLIAADPMFTPGLRSDLPLACLTLSLTLTITQVSHQPHPPFPE